MNAAKRLEIFRRLHEDNPDPKTELAYASPFEPLIAVILSAQATDVVDAVTYRRLLPARTQAAPIARLTQMSHLLAREVETFSPHVLHTTTNYVNALVTQAVARYYGLPWTQD